MYLMRLVQDLYMTFTRPLQLKRSPLHRLTYTLLKALVKVSVDACLLNPNGSSSNNWY